MPQTVTSQTFIGDILYQWDIREYEHHHRGALWHILVISFGLIMVLYALMTGNFLFAVILVLGAIILFLQSNVDPQSLPFAITELGIVVGNRFYVFKEFVGFYIIYNHEVQTLFLDTKNSLRPDIRIPLGEADVLAIRDTLSTVLEENLEKEEPISDRAVRSWKLH